MSASNTSQIVYGIEEKDGEIESLLLSKPDAMIKEKIAFSGACKNMGDGAVTYSLYDKEGTRHNLKVNDKGEIVTDNDKQIKSLFTKEYDEKEIKKMAKGEDSTFTFSEKTIEKETEQAEGEAAASKGSVHSASPERPNKSSNNKGKK